MTNKEKFKEVFGFEHGDFECIGVAQTCYECPFCKGEEGGCAVDELFWNAEYNETLKRCVPNEYQGCRNCEFQIEPLRQCEWAESGGDNDGVLRFVCPRWEKRKET